MPEYSFSNTSYNDYIVSRWLTKSNGVDNKCEVKSFLFVAVFS